MKKGEQFCLNLFSVNRMCEKLLSMWLLFPWQPFIDPQGWDPEIEKRSERLRGEFLRLRCRREVKKELRLRRQRVHSHCTWGWGSLHFASLHSVFVLCPRVSTEIPFPAPWVRGSSPFAHSLVKQLWTDEERWALLSFVRSEVLV